MKNSTFLYILATLCYIGCLFIDYQLLFLCGSIFFAAQIITKTLEEREDKLLLKSFKIKYLYDVYFSKLNFGHSVEDCKKYLDEIERLNNDTQKNL